MYYFINKHCQALKFILILKLTHDIPMTSADYQELERIFTKKLGTK